MTVTEPTTLSIFCTVNEEVSVEPTPSERGLTAARVEADGLAIVGGTFVAVGGTFVAVGGTLVAVGGTFVAVGGTRVAVGGTLVAVGGTVVAVDVITTVLVTALVAWTVGVDVAVTVAGVGPCADATLPAKSINPNTAKNAIVMKRMRWLSIFSPNLMQKYKTKLPRRATFLQDTIYPPSRQ